VYECIWICVCGRVVSWIETRTPCTVLYGPSRIPVAPPRLVVQCGVGSGSYKGSCGGDGAGGGGNNRRGDHTSSSIRECSAIGER
jgi:hypothetical protein